MSKNRLLSGRVKKLTGAALDANRGVYLSLDNAEPDLGLPSTNGQVIASTTAGVRSFVTLATSATTDTTNAANITSGTLPNARLTSVPNSALANSKVTVGATDINLGASATALAGLTSVTSTAFVGALTGNASTVTNGVYTTDTGSVTNAMLAGSIANVKLFNSSVTIGSTAVALGATVTAFAGLTSVTSTAFVGALTGNASTVTNGVYTTDTGSVTNAMLAGSITTNKITGLATVATSGSYADLSNKPTLTSALSALTDVVITTPANQQVLVYNTSTSKWINSSVNIPYFVLSGATTVYINQVVTYTVNDYDAFSTYSVSVTAGSATILGDTITFTTPSVSGTVTMTISNGTVSRTVSITVLTSGVQTPTVTNPSSSPYTYYIGSLSANSFTFTTSAFVALGAADTHLNSDWQLATDAGFTTFASQSLANSSNKIAWTQTLGTVGTYYLRVRHRGTANGASAYSSVVIITVLAASVQAPTITSPTSGTINYNSPSITFASSAFVYLGTFDAHASSDWQISTDSSFVAANFASVTASTTNKTSWTVTGLSAATTYYARVRYTGSTNGTSAYSATWNITTISQFSSYITTPTATPAIGASFEGGYYTGLIWNEVVQSSTSFAIGTGQKTFTVPDMTSVPIVYQGQSLQIRSRANPSTNYMTATVAQAGSTNLVLNVSAAFGSGTFTDWSIMSLYRIILAPKASGDTTAYYRFPADTQIPATITVTEGRKATVAMVAVATSYAAANFCYNLNIAGYTDWYLPARDEFELVWRNLKPVTNSNYVATDRPTGVSYTLLGSYGDTSTAQGSNANSSPVGAAYTTGSPAQTAVTVFQTGGTEALVVNNYWTSTGHTSQNAFSMQSDGRQVSSAIQGTLQVRAVRRSII